MRPEGANRLFRELRVNLPEAGTLRVEIEASRAEQAMTRSVDLEIAEARGSVERYWAYIALAPAGVLVLALHQLRVLGGASRSRRKRRRV